MSKINLPYSLWNSPTVIVENEAAILDIVIVWKSRETPGCLLFVLIPFVCIDILL